MQPTFLDAKSLSSINFWMNSAEARSSTHYDPHHNLLCVVSGRKKGQSIVFLRDKLSGTKTFCCLFLVESNWNRMVQV